MDHAPQCDVWVGSGARNETGRQVFFRPRTTTASNDADLQRPGVPPLRKMGNAQLDFAPSRPVENVFRERLRKDNESIAVPAVNSNS